MRPGETRGPVPGGVIVGAVILGIGVLVLGGFLHIRAAREAQEEKVYASLQVTAEATVARIVQWLEDKEREVEREADGTLVALLENGALEGLEPWRSLLMRRLRVWQGRSDFQEVVLLDREGRPVMLPGVADFPEDPETATLVDRARGDRGVVRGDLHRCTRQDHVHLEFVRAVRTPDGELLGFLVGRITAEDHFYPDLLRVVGGEESLEVFLLRREADRVVLLSPLYHGGVVVPFGASLSLKRSETLAVIAVGGIQGPVEARDHGGRRVMGYARPVPGTPWVLAARIDREEALRSWQTLRIQAEALVVLAILLAGVVGLLVRQWQRLVLTRRELDRERALGLALAESEAILQGIGDGVIATDIEGRIRRINPVASALTGFEATEALGRPLGEVFRIRNEESHQPVEDPVARVLNTGKVVGLANHTELVRRDGTVCPIADSGAPVFDNAGRLWGVVLVFRDQSVQRAWERQVSEARRRQDCFFQQLPLGVVLGRLEVAEGSEGGAVMMETVNPAFARMVGQPPEALVGRRLEEVLGPAAAKWCLPGATGGEVFEEDWPLDPARRVRVTHVHLGEGQCAAVFEDVTEARRAEEERRRRDAVAEHQQRLEALGMLASGVAHEINNPIQAILNYGEILAAHPENAERAREFAPFLIQEAEQVAMVVRNLLGFARQEGEGISTVSARTLWDRALLLVHVVLQRAGIEVTVEAPESLPMVRCRPAQVLQVLVNLLLNARDALAEYAPEEGHPRRIACRSAVVRREGRSFLRLSVQDNGPGIPQEVQRHLFEPFFTTKPQGQGTGLGLWISRKITTEHGGYLELESREAEGTTFHLDLPSEVTNDGVCAGGG